MKKEIFSVSLLAAMLIAAFINIWYLKMITDEMSELVTAGTEAVAREDWETAVKTAKQAEQMWNDNDGYTHVVLRHSEIDTVSDALYDFLADVYEHNAPEALAGAEKVIYHLNSVYQMEQVRWGSIF